MDDYWTVVERLLENFIAGKISISFLWSDLEELSKRKHKHSVDPILDRKLSNAWSIFSFRLDASSDYPPVFSEIRWLRKYQQKKAYANGDVAFGPDEIKEWAQQFLQLLRKERNI